MVDRGVRRPYSRAMERTRLTGALLMIAMVMQMLLFLVGMARRSYAALALPVAVILTVGSVLGFWVGWTLLAMEDDLTDLEFEAEPLDDV